MDRRNRYSPGNGRTGQSSVNKVKSAIEKFQPPQNDSPSVPSSSQTRTRGTRNTHDTRDTNEPRSRATVQHVTRSRDVRHVANDNVEPQPVQEKKDVYEQDGKTHYTVTKTINIGVPSSHSNGSLSSNPDTSYYPLEQRHNLPEQPARSSQSHSSHGSTNSYQSIHLNRPLSQESTYSDVFDEPRRRPSYDAIAEPVECQPVYSSEKGSQNYPTVEMKQPIIIKPNDRRALASSLFLSAHRAAKGSTQSTTPLSQPRKLSTNEYDTQGNRVARPFGQQAPLLADAHDGRDNYHAEINSPSFASANSQKTFETPSYPEETPNFSQPGQPKTSSRVIMLGENQRPPVVSTRQLDDGSHQAEITFLAKLPSGQIIQDNSAVPVTQFQTTQYEAERQNVPNNLPITLGNTPQTQVHAPSVHVMSSTIQQVPSNRKLSQTQQSEPVATQSPARHQINLKNVNRKESRDSSSEPGVKVIRSEFSVDSSTEIRGTGFAMESAANIAESETKASLISAADVKTTQVKTHVPSTESTKVVLTEPPTQETSRRSSRDIQPTNQNPQRKPRTNSFEPSKSVQSRDQKKEETKPIPKSSRDTSKTLTPHSKGAKPTYLVDARQSLKSTKSGAKKQEPVLDLPKIKSRPHGKDNTLLESRATLGARGTPKSKLEESKGKGNDSTPSWVKTAQQRKEEAEAKKKKVPTATLR